MTKSPLHNMSYVAHACNTDDIKMESRGHAAMLKKNSGFIIYTNIDTVCLIRSRPTNKNTYLDTYHRGKEETQMWQ